MDNLRTAIELLFVRRKLTNILDSLTFVNVSSGSVVIGKDEFKELFLSQWSAQYSGNQLNSLYEILNGFWSQNKILEPIDGESSGRCFPRNVFNVLTHFTSQMLVSNGGEPQCRYEEYLRWSEMSKLIGEDILVTNFLAAQDFKDGLERTDFAWPPYILTGSSELRGLMKEGLAELHNHLKGSSLVFTLSWLAVMNYPRTYGHSMFKQLTNYDGNTSEIHLAAFIRSILFKQIFDIEYKSMDVLLNDWITSKDKQLLTNIQLKDIQDFIEFLRNRGVAFSLDYAIPAHLPLNTDDVDSRIPLIGERYLLYKCFEKVIRGSSKAFERLLYIYLIIKTKFRYAMIQVNSTIGFENFQYYDQKKSTFLKALKKSNPRYKEALEKIGMRLPIQEASVKHIEYRITPEDTERQLISSIDSAEAYKVPGISHGYIIHFIKEPDDIDLASDKPELGLVCRNQTLREKINRQANVVGRLLEKGEERIIGIDAANSEFYCRPEVFGVIFRRLRHVHRKTDLAYLQKINPIKLGVTFHVGEDFYDVIDGLRAIDEAIKFLNLRNGDRIGHGTALGIDVFHYYDEKHFTVVMPKQILLDNIAWVLEKMEQYNVPDNSGFKYVAERRFSTLCAEVFAVSVDKNTYINSWLLRGDAPLIYKDLDVEPTRDRLLDIYELNMDNSVIPARKDQQARELYCRYHYDPAVKSRGTKQVEWKIDAKHRATFVDILKKIQENMQSEVAEKHIAIECNPTSNLRIGNIPRYIDHPIIKFNNEDLIRTDGEKMPFSSQISVSINTDDAGIFATSLEKEYTLMALALEKERDENGNPKYQRSSVYRWLENIRQAAFVRKFGADN